MRMKNKTILKSDRAFAPRSLVGILKNFENNKINLTAIALEIKNLRQENKNYA